MHGIVSPISIPSLPLTEAALAQWLAGAPAGARIEYHRGLLAVDMSSNAGSPLPVHERRELHRVAARAWRLADAGLVHLLQRRHGECEVAYLLEIRPRPLRLSATQEKLLAAKPIPSPPTEESALAA
jgi:hypothetical protein